MELERVLNYDKLRQIIPPEKTKKLLETINAESVIIKYLPIVHYSPDPEDNKILATAIAGKVDFIVTGDKRDLLFLGDIRGISIITARSAVDMLTSYEKDKSK